MSSDVDQAVTTETKSSDSVVIVLNEVFDQSTEELSENGELWCVLYESFTCTTNE